MTPEIVTAVASGVAVILGSFFGFTKWMITKFLSELKPNGGSSMRDQVNTNTERLERVEKRIDDIYQILATR
ncbi:hypothetical protein EBU24_05275, partial [bacterium]|nr:hypothetical protein [bacterium]